MYHYVAQAGLELKILLLLPLPPEYWDYRCVLPHQVANNIFDKQLQNI
jgi:hypothetical protein